MNLFFGFKNLLKNRPIKQFSVLMRMNSTTLVDADGVLMEQVGNKGLITLNRPKALNSLNMAMIRQIFPVLKKWDEDPAMSMVIIKGAGEKAFCAGGDIIEFTEAKKKGDTLSEHFFKEEYTLNNTIATMQIPYVALIDGITMGGGVGLSVHGHFRVATEKTLFAMPETGIGLFPDVGGGYFLPRLGGKLGHFLALTGHRLKGRDVQKAGVATHFVNSNLIPELEKELLDLESCSPDILRALLFKYHLESKKDGEQELSLNEHRRQIDLLFNGKTINEIFHNLEKDGSEWALKQLSICKRMSPTSMVITLKQLQKGANMTLQDVLQMEYRLSQRFMEDKDIFEGVRAVVIDKDHKPVWDPASYSDISNQKIEWYFSSLGPDRDLFL